MTDLTQPVLSQVEYRKRGISLQARPNLSEAREYHASRREPPPNSRTRAASADRVSHRERSTWLDARLHTGRRGPGAGQRRQTGAVARHLVEAWNDDARPLLKALIGPGAVQQLDSRSDSQRGPGPDLDWIDSDWADQHLERSGSATSGWDDQILGTDADALAAID